MHLLDFLKPWEFSPVLMVSFLLLFWLYTRGFMAIKRVDRTVKTYWQAVSFYIGLFSIYIVSHTYIDYLSQYMFWVHRFQHLVLHHLAPMLMVLGAVEIVRKGLPNYWPCWSSVPTLIRWPCERLYHLIQHPVLAPILFVGLIYLWLIPDIHFIAMLSKKLYYVMNWSMLLDGFLFWWLVLGPEWRGEGKGFKTRIIMMFVVVVPQQLLGAYLTFSTDVIYDVYDVCGRAWPISPIADQIYGGIITWIPASMMSVLGLVLVLRRRLNYQKNENYEKN
ncbi:cytochrome c oxidase assembly protein [Cycloclasticus pugetii]|uniref:cytochrome c oxidase assembly protein n=1 Tax=Cycloclasticus pugetii TaxID=34068 RepID=UPI002409C4F9|nr:cytochrome c oxidase assembly protein [Cycloclasticus pugetii]MDF1828909.1 cytochrome c oxidase assembly protein [Cycloclasticus pugetii]